MDSQYNKIMEEMILSFRLLHQWAIDTQMAKANDLLDKYYKDFENSRMKMNELFDKINK